MGHAYADVITKCKNYLISQDKSVEKNGNYEVISDYDLEEMLIEMPASKYPEHVKDLKRSDFSCARIDDTIIEEPFDFFFYSYDSIDHLTCPIEKCKIYSLAMLLENKIIDVAMLNEITKYLNKDSAKQSRTKSILLLDIANHKRAINSSTSS